MSDGVFSGAAYASPIVAFGVCYVIVRWLVQGAGGRFGLDQPNERSLHVQPVPRLGGVGLIAGTFAGWLLGHGELTSPLWFGGALLALVSFIEDVRGVPMGTRFLAHFVAAGYFVYVSPTGALPWPALAVVVVGIVWVTNLYNFMDGSDGLAGGMAIFGFGAYATGAWLSGASELAFASGCIASAAAAFVLFNFAPARIFMGDTGSIPLGFLAAAFGLTGWGRGLWPAWFPVLVFSPFLVDASVTIVARQLRGEKVWRAHRSHYYQRLVLLGWGHRKVALAEYALMIAVGTSAIGAMRAPAAGQLGLVVAWVAGYAIILRSIDVRWSRQQSIGRPATPET
jgi:UDP-N-acetylmuramyl pentapeptide phosphotransferase/UDP-N-acetylglucosamine-1-phosphate transferase